MSSWNSENPLFIEFRLLYVCTFLIHFKYVYVKDVYINLWEFKSWNMIYAREIGGCKKGWFCRITVQKKQSEKGMLLAGFY